MRMPVASIDGIQSQPDTLILRLIFALEHSVFEAYTGRLVLPCVIIDYA